VLPIALEDATKIVQAFLLSGKEYVCLMQLHEDIPSSRVESILREFAGEIYQKPPLRASVKREIRKRRIYSIDILEIDGRRVLFKVGCQAGTYVRKLVSDIGEVLGSGAHMAELRRTRAGPFTEEKNLYTLYDVLNACAAFKETKDETLLREIVKPVEEAFEYVPKIYVRDSAVDAICHGADLAIPGIVKLDSHMAEKAPVAIFTLKGEIVALAKALLSTEQIMDQEKGLAAKTVRVIMPAETYPRMWRSKTSKPL